MAVGSASLPKHEAHTPFSTHHLGSRPRLTVSPFVSERTRKEPPPASNTNKDAPATTLPYKLWHRIAGFAADPDAPSRPDFDDYLLSPFGKDRLRVKLYLCVVSRSFCRITLPFLYELIVIDTPEAVQSLAYTLVHSPNTSGHASRVHMRRIIPKTFGRIRDHDSLVEAITQIFNSTINLRAFHIQKSPEDQMIGEHLDFTVPPCSILRRILTLASHLR